MLIQIYADSVLDYLLFLQYIHVLINSLQTDSVILCEVHSAYIAGL